MVPEHLKEKVEAFIASNGDFDIEVVDDDEHGPGLLACSKNWNTKTHIGWDALDSYPIPVIRAACVRGHDVDHITRVTGYFSRTGGWNKGKTGELKDRHRSREL